MFTPAAKAMAEKLGLKMGRANLDEFAATLEELAKATDKPLAAQPNAGMPRNVDGRNIYLC